MLHVLGTLLYFKKKACANDIYKATINIPSVDSWDSEKDHSLFQLFKNHYFYILSIQNCSWSYIPQPNSYPRNTPQVFTSTFHQFFKQHTIYTKFDFHPSVFSDLDLIILIVLATYCGGLWCLWLEVEVDGLGVLCGLGAGRGVPLIDQIQEWAAVFFDRLKQQFYRSSL